MTVIEAVAGLSAVDSVEPDRPPRTPPAGGPRRFAGNAFWTLAGHLVGKGAGFAFVVLVARGLGATAYGNFNFALSFVALFQLAWAYVIELAVMREVAKSEERLSEVFASGLFLRLTFALGAFGLAVLLAPLFVSGGRNVTVVALLGAALCLDEFTTYVGSVYKAFGRVALHGLAIVANRALSAVLAVVVLALGGDIVAVSVAYLAGSVGALVFACIGLRRYFPPIDLRAVRRPVVRELLADGAPMAVAGLFNGALFRIDIVLLQWMKGPLAGGFYGVAYRFFDSFLFLSWSMCDVTLPRIARAGRGRESGEIFQLGIAVMLALFLPLAVLAPFSSDWAVSAVFSASFRPAAAAVPWLAAAGAFYGIAYAARVSSMALNHRRNIIRIAALVLAVNVAANLAVIPRYGFRGAAIVSCLSEALEAMLLLGTFARANGGLYLRRSFFVPLVAAAVTVFVLLTIGARGASGVIVGAPTYGAALAGAMVFLAPAETRSALRLLRSRLGR